MPPLFISCCLQVRHTKVSENLTATLLKAKLFFNIISIFVSNILLPLDKSIHSCLVYNFPPPSAATGTWHSAVSYLHNGVLPGCFSKDQTSKNVMMWGEDFRVGAVALSIEVLWRPQWFTHLSVAWCCHVREAFWNFSCGTNWTKASTETS